MSADLYFAFTLIVKMAVTAGFVVVATVVAERAGPVYIFLAMDHDASFIAQSAVASLLINGANGIFATAYSLLRQQRIGRGKNSIGAVDEQAGHRTLRNEGGIVVHGKEDVDRPRSLGDDRRHHHEAGGDGHFHDEREREIKVGGHSDVVTPAAVSPRPAGQP